MSSWLLVKNGALIDGTGSAVVPDVSVLVCDNRIKAVGPDVTLDAVPRGEPCRVVDATGKSVMPGLIDAHCHLSYGESRTQEEQDIYTGVELRTLRAAFNAKKMLRAGVTGISQPGGSYYIGVGIREGIKAGIVEGPRMTAAGRYITTSNGIADFYPTSVGPLEGAIGTLANTAPEMVSEVRKQIKNGVDFIKLADSPFGEFQAFMDDEVKTIADLAHQHHKKVTVHARGSAEVDAAVRAGLDWIMHGNSMTDDVIERLADSKIPLVPTLLLLANFAEWGHLVGTPAPVRDGCKYMLDETAATLNKAREAGVKFLLGTDSGFAVTPFGEWHGRELELLSQYAGLTPLEAIQAGTQNGAVVLGLENEVGVVRPGYLADFIVVDGDPSRDLRVLGDKRRIEVVVLDGKVVEFDEEQMARRWPPEPNIIYSTDELTYELVHGPYGNAHDGGDRPSSEEGKTLAGELRAVEMAARSTD